MLTIKDLHYRYGKGAPVLRGISFKVPKGKLCGLFGPNGSGKTTLFKCCLKFLKYNRGQIYIDGKDVKEKSVKDMAQLISYVPQEHKPPFPYLVKDVVLMGRTPHLRGILGVSRYHKQKALDALEMVGISELANRPYSQLSGGQRQMVLIARAVAQETPLLFLDEPTSALDFNNQIKIWDILRMIARKGTTIVACTHDPNHVLWFCDEAVVMGNQGLVAHGPPKEVISEGILNRIYDDVCCLRNVGQATTVMPESIVNRQDNSQEGECHGKCDIEIAAGKH